MASQFKAAVQFAGKMSANLSADNQLTDFSGCIKIRGDSC
jgi:hypothetical protein